MKTILWKGALIPLMLLPAACDDFAGEAPSAQSGQLRWALDHTILATRAIAERGVSGKISVTTNNTPTDKTAFVKIRTKIIIK